MRVLSLLAAAIFVAAVQFTNATVATAGPSPTQNVASDSYYRFDVDAGVLEVSLKATVQAFRGDATEVYFWAMRGAEDVVVRRGDLVLESSVGPDNQYGDAALVTAVLDRPLLWRGRADFTMTYRVSNLDGQTTLVLPGIIALGLVSQGAGSFVFVDLPVAGDNYLDPGCLKVAHQPETLAQDGYERWVCGEAAMIALNGNDQSVIRRCQNLDDRCRQRSFNWPYAAYVQSITNEQEIGSLSADVEMDRGPVEINLKYFRRDKDWATRQLKVAVAALPVLEDLFGFSYGGESLLMRESYQIFYLGLAGLAFPDRGEVLLVSRTGQDDAVTVHELAHQWAGYNLEASWLWEGLASWATTVVGPQVGVTVEPRQWQSLPYDDPLATWHAGSDVVDPTYWYGKAEAFWTAYEQAIGGRDVMRSVLALSDVEPGSTPHGGRWFMNRGEELGDVVLDDLFLEWVYVPLTASRVLQERRDAIDLVVGLEQTAAEVGLESIPSDIRVNLEEWFFGPIAEQVRAAEDVIAEYSRIQAEADAMGLPRTEAVATSWATSSVADTAALVRDQEIAMTAINNELSRLSQMPDPSGSTAIDRAVAAYENGDFGGAKRLAAESAGTAVTDDAAVQMVAYGRSLEASFSPNMFGRLGMVGQNPEKHLEAAEQALALGDSAGALREAQAAIETWNGAQRRGFLYAGVFGLGLCAFSIFIWWVIRHLESGGSLVGVSRGLSFELGADRLTETDRPAKKAGSFWREIDDR